MHVEARETHGSRFSPTMWVLRFNVGHQVGRQTLLSAPQSKFKITKKPKSQCKCQCHINHLDAYLEQFLPCSGVCTHTGFVCFWRTGCVCVLERACLCVQMCSACACGNRRLTPG